MSTTTSVINQSLIYILAFSILLFFLIIFFMVYFLVRYRKSRNPVPVEIKGGWLLETLWIIAATFLVLTMFLYGLTGFNFFRNVPSDSIRIKVHARQWTWLFEYGNGKKSPDFIVPVGKDILCELFSDDVIHGFYIPAFRIQQDVLPGLKTQVWFNAVTIGIYDILCSQYCGLKHSDMIAQLVVVTEEQFDAWMKGKNIEYPGKIQLAAMVPGQTLLVERGCISCHSFTGSTLVGPTFKGLFGSKVPVNSGGRETNVTADENYIRRAIIDPGADVVDGFRNNMPSGRNVLTDEEIEKIIQYLKEMK